MLFGVVSLAKESAEPEVPKQLLTLEGHLLLDGSEVSLGVKGFLLGGGRAHRLSFWGTF